MKIFLCGLIVVLSGFVGVVINSNYNKKYAFFKDLYTFFNSLKLKIAFFKDKYEECICDYLKQKPNNNFYVEQLKLIKDNQLTVPNLINIMPNILQEEKEYVANIITTICSSEYSQSEKVIATAITFAQDKMKEYYNQINTKGKMIQKIALCVGLVISIIIY